MNRVVAIPKELTSKGDLVVITRKEYEGFLALQGIKEYQPTASEKRELALARKSRKAGNFLTLDELKQKLDFTGRR